MEKLDIIVTVVQIIFQISRKHFLNVCFHIQNDNSGALKLGLAHVFQFYFYKVFKYMAVCMIIKCKTMYTTTNLLKS